MQGGGVYTTRVPERVYHTRVPERVYHTRVHREVYTTRVYGRCTLGYTTRVYHGVYTTLCTPPSLYHPGYTHHATPLVYTLHATARWCTLPCDRALGSTKEKPVGEARLRVLKSLILLGLLWSNAQSYSLSQENKVERLDRRRVNPRYIPYGTVMVRRGVTCLPSDR